MKLHHSAAIAALLFGTSQVCLAEVSNLTNSSTGASKADAEAKVKKVLEEACQSRSGKVVEGSFKVTFEKPLPTGQHYMDATLQCDLP